jgi:hypothetical protein
MSFEACKALPYFHSNLMVSLERFTYGEEADWDTFEV